jgi:hypothetical protein
MILSLWVILLYSLLVFVTYYSFKNTNIFNLGFCGGALIGLVYFLAIPMFFILIFGNLYDPGIMVSSYNPYKDISTTLNIFLGWGVVLLAQRVESKYTVNQNIRDFDSYYINPKKLMQVLLFLYLVISLYSGFSTGMFTEGRHWHDSTRHDSAFFIILSNFANCYRVAFFGCLLFFFEYKKIKIKDAVIMALSLTLFDLFISFNRITAVYFIIFNVIIFRRYLFLMLLFGLPSIPFLVYVSSIWTWFRGVASVDGYSLSGFIDTWVSVSKSYEAASSGFLYQMNSIFESSNILVFHGLVQNVGDSIPVFYGKTYLIRPLTTFIPSSIWTDKPKVFGVYLGDYINGYSGLALNSTLFGEAYANFLYFWPVILFFTLLLFSSIYRRLNKYLPCLTLMSVFIGISIWRFDMNFSVASIYSILFAAFIVRFFLNKKIAWNY